MSSRSVNFAGVPWQSVLDDIAEDIQDYLHKGKVATYIPALANVDPDQFGIAFTDLKGKTYSAGTSANTTFSIQSISKVFALVMALDLEGEELWSRVGREPSGSSFNSIVQLESEKGRPRNPFINAGAIAVTNTIQQRHQTKSIAKILQFIKDCAQSCDIRINEEVAASEQVYGDRNRALAYFMRSYGTVQGTVSGTLKTYFHQCAMEMNVITLSRAGLFLATEGVNPLNNDHRVTSSEHVGRVNSIMMLCGHYDMVRK
jgi:glutaminase